MKHKGNILFFMTPAYGHSLCVLPIIKRLVEKGYRVQCYITSEFQKLVEQCGAEYVSYSLDFENLVLKDVTADFYELMKALTRLNQEAYPLYLPVVEREQPDIILYDSMCAFAKNIAHRTQIPSACMVATLAFNLPVFLFSHMFPSSVLLYLKNRKGIQKVIKDERHFRRQNSLPRFRMIDLFMNRAKTTIVLSPKEFQPFYRTFSKRVHFVGTTLKDKIAMFHEPQKEYEAYDLYISMGSVFTDNIKELKSLFLEEEGSKHSIIAVVGDEEIKTTHDNITLCKWVNQIDVLPHCRFFVNQGGLNSVYESIYFGIPQLCIPKQEEQRLDSIVVQKKKLGFFRKEFRREWLEAAWESKDNLEISRMQKILRQQDGTARAGELIEQAMERKNSG
ncbi:MAG: glycosyltransferase [Lachnospiraceae bacterium]|nr:glycosyltransferase [Lachnospiraceae bacterium]